ncbi:MAG: phosphate butyryltransferase [Candidatus Zixiibacteriota bacterium]|nr:MAG: phosphate butyryltransferase [candidate division Zixibacteria bacterium]
MSRLVTDFSGIVERTTRAVAAGRKPRAGLILPSDLSALNTVCRAASLNLVEPVLIGDEPLARKNLARLDEPPGHIEILDFREPDMAMQAAVGMAASGQLDLLVSGRVSQRDLLRTLLDRRYGFVSREILSHVAVMKPALYDRLFFLTDAAVNIEPDLECKLRIIENAVEVARIIGVDRPRVALIAAVDMVYTQMPVTTDAAVIAKMAERGQIENAWVDGPFSFDVAVDDLAARAKGIKDSPVAGRADIVIAPGLETANGVYRAMSLYGEADIGGVIFGGAVPVVMNLRTEPDQSRLNSIILGTLIAAS